MVARLARLGLLVQQIFHVVLQFSEKPLLQVRVIGLNLYVLRLCLRVVKASTDGVTCILVDTSDIY